MRASAQPDIPGIVDERARAAVSVVVPFAGDREAGRALFEAISELRLGPRDELIVADNSPTLVLADLEPPARCRVVAATGEGSPARARNAGALHATGEWLLFLDSDCRPIPDLLDTYLAAPLPEDCGMVAGRVTSDPGSSSLAAEYARTRGVLDQQYGLDHPFLPYAVTANLLVRRDLWRSLGGFLEGIFNGEDVDLCWRAQYAGWTLQYNPDATVAHVDRERLPDLLRQATVQRASARWLRRRWPQAPLPPLYAGRILARSLVAAPVFLLSGQPRRAALKVVDGAVALAKLRGELCANHARRRPAREGDRRPIQIWCDEFPVLSETFVAEEARALAALGHPVQVVAAHRPERPALGVHDVQVRWLEDYSRLERLGALIRVAARRPARCLHDLLARARWRVEEEIIPLRTLAPAALQALRKPDLLIHAHFAGVASLGAMRVARIAGRPWTLTAHAYDIYKLPRNLETKLRSAELVTSGCDYTVEDLRRIAGPDHAGRVIRVVMGVDPERFRRSSPHPGGRTVIAIGRLVEKKGFVDLVRAAADPALAGTVDRLLIIGDGPLHDELASEIEKLGVGDVVELTGRREPDEVRALLESADVLAMPCVVAADGDRDSMPVVVKEALAMEIPVVVTDEVGLPELARPEFGRIVPPGDAAALAQALAEVLALPPAHRAEMGRAGRAFVTEHANVHVETATLSDLLERAGRRGYDSSRRLER